MDPLVVLFTICPPLIQLVSHFTKSEFVLVLRAVRAASRTPYPGITSYRLRWGLSNFCRAGGDELLRASVDSGRSAPSEELIEALSNFGQLIITGSSGRATIGRIATALHHEYRQLSIGRDARVIIAANASNKQDFLDAVAQRMGVGTLSSHKLSAEKVIPRVVTTRTLDRCATRKDVVTAVAARLAATGIVFVVGASGMGKSTLAELVALGGMGTRSWVRFRVRDFAPQELLTVVDDVVSQSGADSRGIILDDVPDNSGAIARLIELIAPRISDSFKVLVTTTTSVDAPLRMRLGLSPSCEFSIPRFSQSDVTELLRDYDCPSQIEGGYASAIHSHTRGHPLLVHAAIDSLHAKSWSKTWLDVLLDFEPFVDDVREHSHRALRLSVDESAYLLAARLSVYVGQFSRQDAIRLANDLEPIKNPNRAFEMLIGPWVEPLGSDHFTLSPLLSGLASKALPNKTEELHSAAARSILKPVLTVGELASMVFHGLIGEEPQTLLVGLRLMHEREVRLAVAQHNPGLPFFAVGVNRPMTPNLPMINAMYRGLQFQWLLESTDGERVEQALDDWEAELREPSLVNAIRDMIQHSHADVTPSSMLSSFSVSLYGRALTQRTVKLSLARTARYLKELETALPLVDPTFEDVVAYGLDLEGHAVEIVFNAYRGLEGLEQFLSDYAAVDESTKEILRTYLNSSLDVLLRELWAFYPTEGHLMRHTSTVFAELRDLAGQHGLENLGIASSYILAASHFEDRGDPQLARGTLRLAESLFGNHIALDEYRARLEYYAGSLQQSLALFETVLAARPETISTLLVYSHGYGAMAAFKAEEWNLALGRLRSIRDVAAAGDYHISLVTAIDADIAHTLIAAGNYSDAARQLYSLALGFEASAEESARVKAVQNHVACLSVWLWAMLSGDQSVSAPSYGVMVHSASVDVPPSKLMPASQLIDVVGAIADALQEHELFRDVMSHTGADSRLDFYRDAAERSSMRDQSR